MTVFKYEWQQLRKETLIWSLVLSLMIITALPVYVDMITGYDFDFENFKNADFYELLGTSIKIIATPIGTYSFLNTFILYACAVNGMRLGIGIFTKEYINKTSEFLITKPHTRGEIYIGKWAAAMVSGLTIGIFYLLASLVAMRMSTADSYKAYVLIQIGLSTVFVFMFFLVIGFVIGVLLPHVRAKLSIAFAASFMAYVFYAFYQKTHILIVGLLSPFTYFDGAKIITRGSYNLSMVLIFTLVILIFWLLGKVIYEKKDIRLIS